MLFSYFAVQNTTKCRNNVANSYFLLQIYQPQDTTSWTGNSSCYFHILLHYESSADYDNNKGNSWLCKGVPHPTHSIMDQTPTVLFSWFWGISYYPTSYFDKLSVTHGISANSSPARTDKCAHQLYFLVSTYSFQQHSLTPKHSHNIQSNTH